MMFDLLLNWADSSQNKLLKAPRRKEGSRLENLDSQLLVLMEDYLTKMKNSTPNKQDYIEAQKKLNESARALSTTVREDVLDSFGSIETATDKVNSLLRGK